MSSPTLHFGLLMSPTYQLLDAAGPIDYINNHSRAIVSLATSDDAFLSKCPNIVWHYISWDLCPIQPSSGPVQYPTCTYADCPPLNYLIVPGPDKNTPLPEGCADFLCSLMASENFKALLTVCTGSMLVAQSGILDGLRACSNKHEMRAFAKEGKLNPSVKWVADRRWVVDGKVWSAGGVTAGLDMAAEFARVHFDQAAVELIKQVSEYEPKAAHPDSFARILEGVILP